MVQVADGSPRRPAARVQRPVVSVVVPTRNRTTRLFLTLAALVRQTLAPEYVEVVVVNDAPVRDMVDEVLAQITFDAEIQVFDTGGAGVARARNTGARAARGEILLFLDDDTVASPRLLEYHVEAHAQPRPSVVHGRVTDLAAFTFAPDPWPMALPLVGAGGRKIELADVPNIEQAAAALGPRRSFIEKMSQLVAAQPAVYRSVRWLLCIGTNTSMPRAVFDQAGQFDESYGDLWGGEDLELGLRLAGCGLDFRLIEAPAYHVATARRDVDKKLSHFWHLTAERHGNSSLAAVSDFLLGEMSLDDLTARLDRIGRPDSSSSSTQSNSRPPSTPQRLGRCETGRLSMTHTSTPRTPELRTPGLGPSEVAYRTNMDTFDDVCDVIAGGVSSNMRVLGIPIPLVVRDAQGCRLRDVEGNELIDLNMGYGPHLFGYADRDVVDDIADQFHRGHMTGLPHELDFEAASLIAELVPSVEQVRFANSGTEAVASAVRLARASTGRSLVLTFEGHYHGWSETLLRAFKTTSGLADQPQRGLVAGAPGMIPEALNHTLQIPWNDPEALDRVFDQHGSRIAAAILEPVLVNAGVVPPASGFLGHLRELTSRHGALLIFDEVITGFRVARGGAQERYSVQPDLTVLSKVLGGGFPVAAFGGNRQVMAPLARNEAFHAGVYAGNHAAIRAVASMLSKIRRSPGTYSLLEEIGAYTEQRLTEAFSAVGRSVLVARVGSVMSVATLSQSRDQPDQPGQLQSTVPAVDVATHRELQMHCQRNGVYFHPSPWEPWFLSTAHSKGDIDQAVQVIQRALA